MSCVPRRFKCQRKFAPANPRLLASPHSARRAHQRRMVPPSCPPGLSAPGQCPLSQSATQRNSRETVRQGIHAAKSLMLLGFCCSATQMSGQHRDPLIVRVGRPDGQNCLAGDSGGMYAESHADRMAPCFARGCDFPGGNRCASGARAPADVYLYLCSNLDKLQAPPWPQRQRWPAGVSVLRISKLCWLRARMVDAAASDPANAPGTGRVSAWQK